MAYNYNQVLYEKKLKESKPKTTYKPPSTPKTPSTPAPSTGSTWSDKYKEAEKNKDYTGMIDAATKADEERAARGEATTNRDLVARLKAEQSAINAGVDPKNVDPNYIKALASGDTQGYYDKVLGKTTDDAFGDPAVYGQPDQPGSMTGNGTGRGQSGMKYKVPGYTRPDYTSLLKNRFSNARDQFLAKLRSSMEAAKGKLANRETLARQAGTEALNANDVERAKAMQNMFAGLEATGNYGGGRNISGRIGIDTTAAQNANLINRDVQKEIMDVQAQRDLIENTAADRELEGLSRIGTEEAQALIDAAKFADSMDFQNRQFEYGMSKDAQDRLDKISELTGMVDGQPTLQKQQLDQSDAWRKWEQNFREQEALWQRNPENPAEQAKILSNKAQILGNMMMQMQIDNYPEEQRLRLRQMKKTIDQIGRAQPMTQLEIDKMNAEINRIKAETEAIQNPKPKEPSQTEVSNYWASSAVSELKKLPNYAARKAWLDQHASEIIQNAGQDTYNFLINQLY